MYGNVDAIYRACLDRRTGKEIEKRNLTLVDDTCTEIQLTLWGESAKQDEARWQDSPIVAFKGVKVCRRLSFEPSFSFVVHFANSALSCVPVSKVVLFER